MTDLIRNFAVCGNEDLPKFSFASPELFTTIEQYSFCRMRSALGLATILD